MLEAPESPCPAEAGLHLVTYQQRPVAVAPLPQLLHVLDRSERGIALLSSLLVVALATVLVAGTLDDGQAGLARTRNLVRAEQADALAAGLEEWALQLLLRDLADTTDEMAAALEREEMATELRAPLLRIAEGTAQVERTSDLSADVVLAQIRSIIVDLLQLTGMDVLEATDAIPPARS